jgi:hypothetical protein
MSPSALPCDYLRAEEAYLLEVVDLCPGQSSHAPLTDEPAGWSLLAGFSDRIAPTAQRSLWVRLFLLYGGRRRLVNLPERAAVPIGSGAQGDHRASARIALPQ